MALTFSKKVDTRIGRRKFKVYEVTHDGGTTTVDASDVGLNYIDYAMTRGMVALSAVADYSYLSGATSGLYVTFANALSASAVDVLEVWGY